MSRLDSFIRRLEAQRACINWAAAHISGIPGHVLEIGLGNGRTYDHLRETLDERDIFVIERSPNPHAACMPAAERLLLGDLRDVLTNRSTEFKHQFALVHSDIGTGDPEHGRMMAKSLSEHLPPWIVAGGVVISDQQLSNPSLISISLPDGIAENRYFLYGT